MSVQELEEERERNREQRRAFVKRWAEYVKTHDDREWSRQQNTVIDSQLKMAKDRH